MIDPDQLRAVMSELGTRSNAKPENRNAPYKLQNLSPERRRELSRMGVEARKTKREMARKDEARAA